MTVTVRDLDLPVLGDLSVEPAIIVDAPAVTPATAAAPAAAGVDASDEVDHSASYWVRRRREQARLAAGAAALPVTPPTA